MNDAAPLQTYFHSILDLANALSAYVTSGLRIPDSIASDVLAASLAIERGPYRSTPNGWTIYDRDDARLEIRIFGQNERFFDEQGRESGERTRSAQLSYMLR